MVLLVVEVGSATFHHILYHLEFLVLRLRQVHVLEQQAQQPHRREDQEHMALWKTVSLSQKWGKAENS